jgi:putative transposase
MHDPTTGQSFIRKRRRRYDEVGQPRELTFCCYQRRPFLDRDRPRQWLVEALGGARVRWPIDLWAYVVMPEHVHLLVCPRERGAIVSGFLREVKEAVGRKAVAAIKREAPEWLNRITVHEGNRERHRFWQPGGGYDRNVIERSTLDRVVDYLHANPVRRGLVGRPEDWEWSSARWYAGHSPVALEMDRTLPAGTGDLR